MKVAAQRSVSKDGRTPSKLQQQLANRILGYIRDKNLEKGDRLTELGLAQTLQVSRTPIRAALEYLTSLDVVAPNGPRLGFRVRATTSVVAKLAGEAVQSDEEAIYVHIAEDYVREMLPVQFSEADMMRQYGISRGLLIRVLQRMAREGVIERNAGYGWRFAPLLRSSGQSDAESYRFRLAVEPAALLEPGFTLDRAWAKRCRRDHEEILSMRPDRVSMIRFFDINADFHETLAACSGNPFFHQAAKSQNQLRRFLTYSRTYPLDRIAASCEAHLAILTAVENADQELAATLMSLHLKVAAQQKPANPGIHGQDSSPSKPPVLGTKSLRRRTSRATGRR
jgi:DNA-binding GntR family transcriptional regulator